MLERSVVAYGNAIALGENQSANEAFSNEGAVTFLLRIQPRSLQGVDELAPGPAGIVLVHIVLRESLHDRNRVSVMSEVADILGGEVVIESIDYL